MKEFENQSTFDEVIGKSKVSCLLTHAVTVSEILGLEYSD